MDLLTEEHLNNGDVYAMLKNLAESNYFTLDKDAFKGIYINPYILRFVVRDVRCFRVLRIWTPEIVARALLGGSSLPENLAVISEMYRRKKYARVIHIFEHVSTQLFKKGHMVHYTYKQTTEMIGMLGSMGHGVKGITERLKYAEVYPPCNPRKVLRVVQRWLDEHTGLFALACAMLFPRGLKKRRLARPSLNPDVMGHISSFLISPKRLHHFIDFMHNNKGLNAFTEDMF